MRRELSVPFECRGHRGLISIRVLANNDPWASGHQLVVPDLDAESFRGFPICTATLRYHGQGINAIMGWVQLITNIEAATRSTAVEVDASPIQPGPLYAYGHLPTFFDAPANPDHPDGVWRADTFLVIVPDVMRTRVLVPIAAFRWGYRLVGGHPDPLDPERRDSDWSEFKAVLSAAHPDWSFL
jgi:predicted RNA-binding protein with TRAM domain